MTTRKPLMPKATAAWLVENTALTFEQIADFCQMHLLEVKGIADGDVAAGIKGTDPISNGQLTREEIKRGEADPGYKLRLAEPKVQMPVAKPKKGPRYTPVSRRHDRPNAVLWLLRNHPELRDSQIMRLVGTTKPTILQIKERTHWNSPNLQPQDPVTLGLCTQIDLDAEVKRAAKRVEQKPGSQTGTLLPTSETTGYRPGDEQPRIEDDQPAMSEQESLADEEEAMMARLRELSSAPSPNDAGEDKGGGR